RHFLLTSASPHGRPNFFIANAFQFQFQDAAAIPRQRSAMDRHKTPALGSCPCSRRAERKPSNAYLEAHLPPSRGQSRPLWVDANGTIDEIGRLPRRGGSPRAP